MPNEKFARGYDVTVVVVGADVFLVRQAEAYKVNKVGLFIWNQLEGDLLAPEIASNVTSNFDIDLPAATDDVTSFIAELKSRQLVEIF